MNNPIKDIYPLSALQKSMLFHSRDNSSNYSVSIKLNIEGNADEEKLRQAFKKVCEKHDALRTVFPQKNLTRLVQVVFGMPLGELSAGDKNESSFDEPFDLEKGPLVRGRYIKNDEDTGVLEFKFHHLVTDGWSLDVFLKDFFSFYRGEDAGTAVSMGGAYKFIMKKDTEKALNYFSDHLRDYELSSPANHEFRGEFRNRNRKYCLPGKSLSELSDKLKAHGISQSTLFNMVWGITLGKLTGRRDVVFGNVVSGRNLPIEGIENSVGLYINTLPLRVTYSEDTTAIELLKNMQKTSNARMEYEHVSTADILERTGYGNDLFTSVIAVENYELDLGEVTGNSGLKITEMESSEQSHFGLGIAVYPGPHPSISISSNPYIYSLEESDSFAESVASIIEQLNDNINSRVKGLRPVSSATLKTVLEEFNASPYVKPSERTISAYLHRILSRNTGKNALTCGGITWSYDELYSNALSAAEKILKTLPSGNQTVAVYGDRNIIFMASVLGVLLAGKALLIIDPELPEIRIQNILEDAEPSLIIAGKEGNFPSGADILKMAEISHIPHDSLDEVSEKILSSVSTTASPYDTSYIIFTSGTTGRPKGTLLTSEAAVIMADYMGWYAGLSDPCSISLSPSGFDMFLTDFLVTLSSGGKSVLTSETERKDNDLVGELMVNEGVDFILSTPSRVSSLVTTSPHAFRNMKHIVTGGEKLDSKLFERLNSICQTKLFNAYGPSETTAYNTMTEVDEITVSTIGKPAALSRIMILNMDMNILPPGITGEIAIGGIPVGKGYLKRDELNSEKFIKVSPHTGERVYRTGDTGKWTRDGYIEYSGRMDEQVKINGLRIETMEISVRAASLPGVDKAEIFVYRNSSGTSMLGCVFTGDEGISGETVKSHLSGILPKYMIPSFYIKETTIRTGSRGKFDSSYYKAIAEADTSRINVTEPENSCERAVYEIWKNILKQDKFGTEDHFFSAGGNSLTAMILCSEIKKIFPVQFTLEDFFKTGTVKSMAGLLKETEDKEEEIKGYIPVSSESGGDFPLTFTEERIYSVSLTMEDKKAYNLTEVLDAENTDPMTIKRAVSEVISAHPNLRSVFVQDEEGVTVKRILSREEASDALSFREYEGIKDESTARELLKEFTLSEGPLLECVYIRNSFEEKNILILNFHHIIADGYSLGIILSDLRRAIRGKKITPPERTIMERALFEQKAGISEKSVNFWKEYLKGYSPEERTGGTEKGKGVHLDFSIGRKDTRIIQKAAKDLGISLYQMTFTVFCLARLKETGRKDGIFATLTSGRSHEGTQEMVGMMAETVPFRLRFEESERASDLLKKSMKSLSEIIVEDSVPLGEILNSVESENEDKADLLSDLFILQEFSQDSSEESLRPVHKNLYTETTKFPLTVEASVEEDEIRMAVNFDETKFPGNDLQSLMERFRNMLVEISQNPSVRMSEIKMLTEGEKEELMRFRKASDPVNPISLSVTLVSYLEKIMEEFGDRKAVTSGLKSLTFSELQKISSGIAATVSERVTNGGTAAIMMDRCEKVPAAVIGVLKAGSPFILIDTSLPEERVRFILENSGAELILTDKGQSSKYPTETITVTDEITYEKEWKGLPEERGEDAAYMIFTSGTTGRPKGVINHRAGLLNSVMNIRDLAGETAENTAVLSLTSFSFDMFLAEMFMSLSTGRNLVIAGEDERMDPLATADLMRENRADLMWITPSRLKGMSEEKTFVDETAKLSGIFLGGEALDKNLKEKLENTENLRVFNMYGPSEVSIFATGTETKKGKGVTIGKPLSGNTIDIAGKDLRLLPPGKTGEIIIGGIGVGYGYHSDTEKTSLSFVQSPEFPGETVYRTGDLGRWDSEGNIIFEGRCDRQIKIRGYRIEPEEIMAASSGFEGVRECHVSAFDKEGSTFLCAFISGDTDTEKLNDHLSEMLPYYMVPEYIVKVESIPVTPAGKTDERKLREILDLHLTESEDRTEENEDYILSESEKIVKGMFEKILRTENPGINESFYRLGGDSIKAIQLVGMLRKEGMEISVKNIITLKSIREIAAFLDKKSGKARETHIESAGWITPNPLEVQFLENNVPDARFNQAMVFKTGNKDSKVYEGMIRELKRAHGLLRSRVSCENGEYIHEVISDEETPGNEIKIILRGEEESLRDVIRRESEKLHLRISPRNGRMAEASVVRDKESDYLILCISHLAVDSVSWRIIGQNLSDMDEKGRNGEKYSITPGEAFSEYRRKLDGLKDHFEKQRPFWENTVRDDNGDSELSGEMIFHELIIPEETTGSLKKGFIGNNTGFQEALLASFTDARSYISGREDEIIYLESHGREEELTGSDLTGTVGWFTSVYPLRTGNGKTLKEKLREVTLALNRIPDMGLGFGILSSQDKEGVLKEAFRKNSKVFFNYLGEMDLGNEAESSSGFIPVSADTGDEIGREVKLCIGVSFNAVLLGGELRISLMADRKMMNEDEMKNLCERTEENLMKLSGDENREILDLEELGELGIEMDELSDLLEEAAALV